MELETLKSLGQIAGVAGIVVGTLLILYRQIIAKKIFPNLTKKQAFKILLVIIIATWSIAIAGIGAWVYVGSNPTTNSTAEVDITEKLIAVKSLNDINYSLYIELKQSRLDTTLDTYQNLQLIKTSKDPKLAFYQSNVRSLRENNKRISDYLIELQSKLKTFNFKQNAEQFIKHSGLVDARYESAVLADSLSDLPKITIKYPVDFGNNLDEEIKSWKK